MHNEPSRREKREDKFFRLAEQGKFEAEPLPYLYRSEEKSLQKNGFTTKRIGENKKVALPTEVSWKNPFKDGIPLVVSSYIIGEIQTFPKVENLAQELYVIASRANFEKNCFNRYKSFSLPNNKE